MSKCNNVLTVSEAAKSLYHHLEGHSVGPAIYLYKKNKDKKYVFVISVLQLCLLEPLYTRFIGFIDFNLCLTQGHLMVGKENRFNSLFFAKNSCKSVLKFYLYYKIRFAEHK